MCAPPGGVPYNGETETYVARINAALATFGTPGQPGAGTAPGLAPNDGRFASNVVFAAQRWIGQRYVWGGGDANGPTGGGFDCSGLTLHAVYTASGGGISLPHNAAAQPRPASREDLICPSCSGSRPRKRSGRGHWSPGGAGRHHN